MLIGYRNGILECPPYDAEIEYLESTGTQWIDTEIKPTDTLITSLFGLFPSTATATRFGVRVSGDVSQYCILAIGDSTLRIDLGTEDGLKSQHAFSQDTYTQIYINASSKYVFVKSNSGTESAYTYQNTTLTFDNAGTITVFAFRNGNDILTATNMRVSSLKMQYSTSPDLVRNFIPVRKDNTGYLFDKVSKKLFGNSGTGNFVLGPDKL